MRTLIIIAFFSLAGLSQGGNLSARVDGTVASNGVMDSETIRWALAQIESGHLKNQDAAKGASGEVSRFQIMPEVWRDYSASRNFKNPVVSWSVAFKILQDRYSWFLRSTGREPSAFDLYVMWNKPGLYGRVDFDPDRLPRRVRNVATRFENLVESFQSRRELASQSN